MCCLLHVTPFNVSALVSLYGSYLLHILVATSGSHILVYRVCLELKEVAQMLTMLPLLVVKNHHIQSNQYQRHAMPTPL